MTEIIIQFFKFHKKAFQRTLLLLLAFVLLCLGLALAAVHGAAHLFNQAVARQTMLRGTITVETLAPHITGHVGFTELVWKDPQGHVLLYVPDGSLTVRPWDIITRSIKSTTITNITLNNATIAAYFDDDMRMDIISTSENDDHNSKKDEPKSIQDKIRNFNWNGQKIHGSIDLNNCRFEAYHMSRYYVMNSVNAHIGIHTGQSINLNFSTGRFDGTAVGDGIAIKGKVNLKLPMPVMDMKLDFVNIDPSSLGLGNDVHDQMTLTFRAQGPLDHPTASGKLKMKELTLPALYFTNVRGNVFYDNSILNFTDVHADVYNGKLTAYGNYNLETRAYSIYGEGTGLDSSVALHNIKFRTLVDMKVALICNGQPHDFIAYGGFHSGSGYYFPLHFNYIAGRFNNRYHELDFFDVIISTDMGDIKTDALHIVKGNIQVSPIRLSNPENGQDLILFQPDDYKDQGRKQEDIQKNLKSLQGSLKSIKKSFKDMKRSVDSWK